MIFNRNIKLGIEHAKDIRLFKKITGNQKLNLFDTHLFYSMFLFDLVRILLTMIVLAAVAYSPAIMINEKKKLIILGLVSGFLVTGITVIFTKDKIERIEKGIIAYSHKIINLCKVSLLEKICLSNKSPYEIKWQYIFLANLQVVLFNFVLLNILKLLNAFLGDSSLFAAYFSFVAFFPSFIFFAENKKAMLTLLGGLIVFFAILPTPRTEVEVNNKTDLSLIYKNCSIVIFLLTILKAVSFTYGFLKGRAISDGPVDSFGLVFFIVIIYTTFQGFAAILLHFHNTLAAIKKNKKREFWILELILLFPYLIYYCLFIHLIPLIFISVVFWLINKFFKICIDTFKIPSVIRLIGFVIFVGTSIYNILK